MAALTLAELKLVVNHALGGDPEGIYTDAATTQQQIINEAGRFMVAMHPWSWRLRASYPMTAYASISIADATWTNSTLTLTSTGDFANYTYRQNDLIEITDGTGATAGTYIVASRTSDNAIVLSSTIGSAADGQTDIDATFDQPYMALPSDFGELVDLIPTDSLTNAFRRTTPEVVRHERAHNATQSGNVFRWALVHFGSDTATDNMPEPAIEFYPGAPSDDTDFARLTYLTRWTDLTADTHKPKIPASLEWEAFLVRCVEAFSRRHDDDDYDAINRLLGSAEFAELKKRDGRHQSNLGLMEGGMLQHDTVGSSKPWSSYTDPS